MRILSLARTSSISHRLSRNSNYSLLKSKRPNTRKLCTKPKEEVKIDPPKSDPKPESPADASSSGGGGGLYLLIAAAAGAGGYYFREDIMGVFNGQQNSVESKVGDALAVTQEKVSEAVEEGGAQLLKVINQPDPATSGLTDAELKNRRKEAVEKTVNADWAAVREEIVNLLDTNPNHDDGSYGPVLVRLAWHSAGTFDKNTGTGGTEGAGMRFTPEGKWGANNGLDLARTILEPIKQKFPDITHSDLWSFAGTVAIEEMGGPEMNWRPGRADFVFAERPLSDGRLPDGDGREHTDNPATHVREIFKRMGFNDREMVALIGAHALGRCHTQHSGYDGPWTFAPTTFSNEYFRLLMEEEWTPKQWDGPLQFEDSTGGLMMLPTDMALKDDDKFAKISLEYVADEEMYFKDFAKAWMKLQENGVKKFNGWRKYYVFGPRGE